MHAGFCLSSHVGFSCGIHQEIPAAYHTSKRPFPSRGTLHCSIYFCLSRSCCNKKKGLTKQANKQLLFQTKQILQHLKSLKLGAEATNRRTICAEMFWIKLPMYYHWIQLGRFLWLFVASDRWKPAYARSDKSEVGSLPLFLAMTGSSQRWQLVLDMTSFCPT